MESFAGVYDDLIPSGLADNIESEVLKASFPWYYISNIAEDNPDVTNPGFTHSFNHIQLPTSDPNLWNVNRNLKTHYEYIFNNILYISAAKLNLQVTYIDQARAFFHLPMKNPGPDAIHTDLDIKHTVCLYYINDSEGDTILFENDRKTEIQRISPKKGRVVFFDGSIPHCSSRPSKSNRMILNFDFQACKFGKEE